MRLIRLVFGLLVFFFSTNALTINYGELSFETVGDRTSIPYGVVTELFQDEQGFIWIGSQRGLVRYDGYEYRIYKHTKESEFEIAGNFIKKVAQCQMGYLWIGTQNDGLSVFDPISETFVNFSHDPQIKHSLSHDQVNDILVDRENNKWIATPTGLNYLENGTREFQIYTEGLNSHAVTSLLLDKENRLWVGTKQGLFRFNKTTQIFEPYQFRTKDSGELSNLAVSELYQSTDGDIWIGTRDRGLVIVSSQNGKITFLDTVQDNIDDNHLSSPWVSSILQVSPNQVWVAMFEGGIDVIEVSTKTVIERISHDISVPSSLNLNSVSKLMMDHSGLLWIGTWGGGLNKYNTRQTAFRSIRYSPTNELGLSHPDVRSILELQDGRWLFGTAENGVDIFDTHFNRIGSIRHQANDENSLPLGVISSLAQTEDGKVWVGLINKGLFELDLSTNTLSHQILTTNESAHSIYRIVADNNNLWVGTGNGVFYVNRSNQKATPLVDQDGNIIEIRTNAIGIDKEKNVWVGTSSGLLYKANNSEYALRFSHEKGNNQTISSNQVSGILVDSKNRVWVDTGAGLNRLVSIEAEAAIFESISQNINMPGYYFGGNLQEDSAGHIWTQWSFLDPVTNQFLEVSNSLSTNVGTVWINSFAKAQSGLLLFGGTRGILIIAPELFSQRKYSPTLAVTELNIDGESIASDFKSFELSPDVKGFSLEFAVLDYLRPEANRYRYKLENYNLEWQETDASHRQVTYTNLPAGEYKLQLDGAGLNENWSEKPITIDIVVKPKLYQTLAFKIAIFVLVCSLLYLFYLYRVLQLKRYQQELKQQVAQRTKALDASHKNLNIITEIGKEITSTKDLSAVLEKIYEHTSQLMDVYVFSIGIYRKEQQIVDFALSIKEGVKHAPYVRDMNLKEQLSVWCINNSQSILITDADVQVSDYVDVEGWKLTLKDHPLGNIHVMQSHLYVPLFLNSEPIGVIAVHSKNKNAYCNTQLKTMEMLGTYAAIAIDNANKIHQVEQVNKSLVQAQNELKASYEKLEEISETDQLTGLKNRHFFMSHIPQDIQKVLRDYRKSELLNNQLAPSDVDMIFFLIDLDHFKQTNDTLGHGAGDEILKSIKGILSGIFRETDYLIRWGGEEFLVVARFTNRDKAADLAERIRISVENYSFQLGKTSLSSQTCSIGFACFPFLQKQRAALGWEQVIEIADMGLYAAKLSKRNAWVGICGGEMLDSSALNQLLEKDLDSLLESRQIRVETSLPSDTEIKWV